MSTADAYSAVEVIEAIRRLEGRRLPRSLLDYYAASGLCAPSVRAGSGRGGGLKTRWWSRQDVLVLRWLVRVARLGVPLRRFVGVASAVGERRRVGEPAPVGDRVPRRVAADRRARARRPRRRRRALVWSRADLERGVDEALARALSVSRQRPPSGRPSR